MTCVKETTLRVHQVFQLWGNCEIIPSSETCLKIFLGIGINNGHKQIILVNFLMIV